MSNSNVYTENMADIMACYTERKEVQNIITAWNENGLPDSFSEYNVRLAFNPNSGYVFLTNDDYEVCMMNGDELEIFYTSPYEGHEGFIEDLYDEYLKYSEHWHEDDIEWLEDIKSNLE